MNVIKHLPGEILGYRKDGRPIYTIAGGALDTVTAPASLNVSPVIEGAADVLTNVGARITGGAQAANAAGGVDWAGNMVTTAYDLVLENATRERLIFDRFATKMPTRLTHDGAVVSFPVTDDLDEDVAGAALSEDYDVLPSKFKTAHQTVGMKEYGRVVTRTNLVRGMSMIPFDPVAAEKIARNAVGTVDNIALAALIAGSAAGDQGIVTHQSGGSGEDFGTEKTTMATHTAAGTPTDSLIEIAEWFQSRNVAPFSNGLYAGILTPADATALRKEADAAGWRYFTQNQNPSGGSGNIQGIGRNSLGVYEGFMFVVSNRLSAQNGGKSVFLGADALAKVFPDVPGFGPGPGIEVAPVVDRLRRFWSIGWLWTGGYRRFRWESAIEGNLGTTP
jgi:hypothetical protein